MKNDHNLSVEDAIKLQAGTGQATLEVTGRKQSYALKWCKPNNDDADDDNVLPNANI